MMLACWCVGVGAGPGAYGVISDIISGRTPTAAAIKQVKASGEKRKRRKKDLHAVSVNQGSWQFLSVRAHQRCFLICKEKSRHCHRNCKNGQHQRALIWMEPLKITHRIMDASVDVSVSSLDGAGDAVPTATGKKQQREKKGAFFDKATHTPVIFALQSPMLQEKVGL